MLRIDVTAIFKATPQAELQRIRPGGGRWGQCLPVNPGIVVQKAVELYYHLKITTRGRAVNDSALMRVLHLTVDALNERERPVNHPRIAI